MIATPPNPAPGDSIQVKLATQAWEREAAFELRRRVFCDEQGLFHDDDRDDVDRTALVLVAVTAGSGAGGEVVGTVRINQEQAAPCIWWGSRLAVDRRFRRIGGLSIGATLIRLAVSSARGYGCEGFYAHVQRQNLPLFKRLRWRSLGEFELHGLTHHRMQADLEFYTPCLTPQAGYVASLKGGV